MSPSNLSNEDWRALYPFKSRYHQLASGPRLHFIDEAPSDSTNGPTILCVHGNPTWSFYYRSIVHTFSSRIRCIAVDHIGCGLSDKPQEYDYCLESHSSNLVELIQALDLRRIVLVVHDWGGAIGLNAALQCLDRIAGLVVLNTAAFPPPYIPLRIAACRIPWFGSFAMTRFNAFARAATVMAIYRLRNLEPRVAAGLLAPYDTPDHRIGIDRFVHDIPMNRKHRTYEVLEKLESNLKRFSSTPIRIVWGMKDWCFRPECLVRFKQIWPHASIRELSDVGHYVMEEAALEVNEEVEILIRILVSLN